MWGPHFPPRRKDVATPGLPETAFVQMLCAFFHFLQKSCGAVAAHLRRGAFRGRLRFFCRIRASGRKREGVRFVDACREWPTKKAAGNIPAAFRVMRRKRERRSRGAFQAVLVLFLFVMITMMCVTRADLIHEFACRLTQWPAEVIDRFVSTIRKAIFGVLVGVVFVALIQGFLCGVGFAIAEVPQPAFWGLIAAFVAPIPFVGTALVWLPVCIWLWLTGSTVACIGLAIWCALVVAGVDNLLRPFFLKTGIDASVVTLILSILCGLAAFGPVGVFAGPVLVAVAIQAGNESTLCRKH